MSTYSITYHPDTPIEKSVAELDLCTIVIQEFAHARLRQVFTITLSFKTVKPDVLL
jgi:hypothetical protein